MKKRAVFLDRDGTINVEKDYLYKISDFEFLPGVIDGLRLLQKAGYLLFIITNQSGIARGYYTVKEYNELTDWMLDSLSRQNVHVNKVYYCPHHPDALIPEFRCECNCRKPNLGLFEAAIEEYNLDVTECFAIGDKIRDCSVSELGCRCYLIGENEKKDTIEAVKAGKYNNIEYATGILDAAEKIVQLC